MPPPPIREQPQKRLTLNRVKVSKNIVGLFTPGKRTEQIKGHAVVPTLFSGV